MGNEIYEILTGKQDLAYRTWPTYDESKLVAEEFELVVQVNGKVRGKIMAPTGIDNAEMEKLAYTIPNVQAHMEGKTVVKVIVIKGKIVNIVVK